MCNAQIPLDAEKCPLCGVVFKASTPEESSIKEEEKLTAFCPVCDAQIPIDAEKCPLCSAIFKTHIMEEPSTSHREEKTTAFCPICDAQISLGTEKCPNCGLDFKTATMEEVVKKQQPPIAEEPKPVDKFKNLRRDKILFYLGIILMLVGGYGLAFGSWLHDVLRVPIMGDSYDAFGWINVYFTIAGVIVLFIGMAFLLLSLRGGLIPKEELKKLEAEG